MRRITTKRAVRVPRRRSALASIAVVGLAFLLSGCINLTADLSIDSQARISGTERIEISKQAASLLGITSLDALKSGAGQGLQGSSTSADDCPAITYGETDTAFTIVCTFKDSTLTSGDITASRVGDSIQFAFKQSGSSTTSGSGSSGSDATPTPTTTSSADDLLSGGNVGVLDVTVRFPGEITSIAGTDAAKAVQVEDDTVQIKGTATESIDVTVTSAIGTDLLPVLTGDDASLPLWLLIGVGLLVLLVLGGIVFALLRARARPATAAPDAAGAADEPTPPGEGDLAAPVGPVAQQDTTPFEPQPPAAPTAPPGWYPNPQTGEGLRYWDGDAWSDIPAPPTSS
jgi:hypothetical protein